MRDKIAYTLLIIGALSGIIGYGRADNVGGVCVSLLVVIGLLGIYEIWK